MHLWRMLLVPAVAMVSLVLAAPVVHAQGGPPQRPFRALFGGDDTSRPARHELSLTLSLTAALDNNAYASLQPTPEAGECEGCVNRSELYTGGALLAYVLRDRNVTFNATGSASYPYYSLLPDQAETPAWGVNTTLGFTPGRTTVNGYGSYYFTPFYSALLRPGYIPPGGSFDYATALSPNELVSGGASATHRLGRSTSASAAYNVSDTRFVDEDRANGSQGVRLSLSGGVSRSVTLGGGYSYSRSRYTDPVITSRSDSQGVDFSTGYSRQWSRSRATVVGASVAWSTVTYIGSTTERWGGSASLNQVLSPGWSVGGSYGRSLQYPSVTREPVWSDAVNVTLGGRFGQRVSVSAGGNYSTGRRVSGGDEGFNSYSANGRVQVALASNLAVSASYIYYRYDYPQDFGLPAGVPPRLDRQRLQFGATFWLPLVHAGRAGGPAGAGSQ